VNASPFSEENDVQDGCRTDSQTNAEDQTCYKDNSEQQPDEWS